MKTTLTLLSVLLLTLVVQACKKDNQKPNTTTINSPATLQQSFAGKWYFVKDSVAATDTYTPIQFPQKLLFNSGDYITFNDNNTGTLSSTISYNALETSYTKLYINPDESVIPTLNFNYKLSATDSTVLVSNADLSNRGYAITQINATSLVLTTRMEIPKYPHDYRFVQQIYFSKK